jgi:hypothetical protein
VKRGYKLTQASNVDFDYKLMVGFPNPGDGIQSFYADENISSQLKSPYFAPGEGYLTQCRLTRFRKPTETEKTNADPARNYFFRVRTIRDELGRFVSANYGKIYGEFLQTACYLNPIPNDRNVDFDPKRNLRNGLRDEEIVKAP